MGRIVLAVAALVVLMWFFSRLGRLEGRERNAWLKRMAAYAAVAVVLLLVVSGKAPVIFAAVAALIPWLQRAFLLRRAATMLGGMGIRIPGLDRFTGAGSARDSLYLRLSRDAQTGRLSGTVMAGQFAGSRLDDLSLPELLSLRDELLRQDPDGRDGLEHYLDQTYGRWRDTSEPVTSMTNMTRDEAFEVLGLTSDATRDDIVEAHRKLMSRLHPDRGGNNYLAVKVNQAKDVLLG